MRKPFLLLVAVVPALLILAACGASSSGGGASPAAGDSQPTGTVTFVAPDQGPSTPAVGTVTVLKLVQGAKGVFLRSRPDHAAGIAAEVQPGDTGTLLGIDASGTWLLVKIKNQIGWAPVQLLNYTIAQ